jgi:anthranilate/para-aminobenzoate synthase component II
MKLLVIELPAHSTSSQPNVRQFLSNYDLITVDHAALDQAPADAAAVVIVGPLEALETSLLDRLVTYQNEVNLPVLGIGSGFEVIIATQGISLAEEAEIGITTGKIQPTDAGARLFQGVDPLAVTDASRWLVDALPKAWQVMARCEECIVAVRHKQLPLWGLQIVPEDFAYSSDANLVYKNYIEQLVASTK